MNKEVQVASNMMAIKNTREQIINGLEKIVPDESAEKVDAKLSTISLEDLVKLTPTELLEFNMLDEENAIIVSPDFEDTEKEVAFIRDHLVYIKKSFDFVNDLDKRLEEFNKIMEETNEALENVTDVDNDSHIIKYTRDSLQKGLKEAKTEDDKKKIQGALDAFEDSFKLRRLIDLYKKIGSDNLKRELKNDKGELYAKYRKASKELKLRFDLATIGDLEKTHLPEEYHESNNLFVIICMKYISKLTKVRGASTTTDGCFAAQLATNIYLYSKGKLPEEEKNIFENAIKELLDVVK